MHVCVNDVLVEELTKHFSFVLHLFGLLSCGNTHCSTFYAKGTEILAPIGFKIHDQ